MCTSQEGEPRDAHKRLQAPVRGGHPPPCGSLQQCRAGLTPQGFLSKAADIPAMQGRAFSLAFRQLQGLLTYLPWVHPSFPLWNTGSKGDAPSTPSACGTLASLCILLGFCKARRAGATILAHGPLWEPFLYSQQANAQPSAEQPGQKGPP